MSKIFLGIFNMSISASYIVLAVLLLRLLLRKVPKWITVLLWGIVGVRLICPFSPESILSLIPSAEVVSPDIMMDRTPQINTGIPIVNHVINPIISASFTPDPATSANPLQLWIPTFAVLWIAGMLALLVYTIISYVKVKRKIGTAVLLRDNIYQSEKVISPFVLGLIRPNIYLPFNMGEQDMAHVIAHEQAHILRKDHLWKPIGFLLLTLHWFNPLMWLGYLLLCRDIELACDEKVIGELDRDARADYSQALLTCSVNRRMIAACPLAFGEVGVKERVKSVLNYKKPAFWIIVLGIIASAALALCFLTNPKNDSMSAIGRQQSGCNMDGVSIKIVSCETSAPDPYLEIEWKNDSLSEITFGERFSVFYRQDGEWVNCSIEENPVWHLIAFDLSPGKSATHACKLNGQMMSQPGTYRLEIYFSVDETSEAEYTAWIEFELKRGVDGMSVHTLTPIELVYNDGSYSYVQTAEVAPTYLLVNGMILLEKMGGTLSEPLGLLEEIDLNEDNFDSRFRWRQEYGFLGKETLGSLKKNNKRAWQLYLNETAFSSELYLLLEQKDGTFYLGYGYYDCNSITKQNQDDSHIRWLYKLQKETGTYGESIRVMQEAELRKSYPHFFGLNADEGLSVYIWQLSRENYSCYLVSTAEDEISEDQFSFPFLEGVSIIEMRTILATYGIEKDSITLKPINHPISSYYYEINDEYRRRLESVFWFALFETVYDSASFDIDGDGRIENCSMRRGMTSGVFTFIFSAQDKDTGETKYQNVIYSNVYDLSFVKGADGITRVKAVTRNETPVTHLFDISIKDGHVHLTENGIPIGNIS